MFEPLKKDGHCKKKMAARKTMATTKYLATARTTKLSLQENFPLKPFLSCSESKGQKYIGSEFDIISRTIDPLLSPGNTKRILFIENPLNIQH